MGPDWFFIKQQDKKTYWFWWFCYFVMCHLCVGVCAAYVPNLCVIYVLEYVPFVCSNPPRGFGKIRKTLTFCTLVRGEPLIPLYFVIFSLKKTCVFFQMRFFGELKWCVAYGSERPIKCIFDKFTSWSGKKKRKNANWLGHFTMVMLRLVLRPPSTLELLICKKVVIECHSTVVL